MVVLLQRMRATTIYMYERLSLSHSLAGWLMIYRVQDSKCLLSFTRSFNGNWRGCCCYSRTDLSEANKVIILSKSEGNVINL